MSWHTILSGFVKVKEKDYNKALDMLAELEVDTDKSVKLDEEEGICVISFYDDELFSHRDGELIDSTIKKYRDILLGYRFSLYSLDEPDYQVQG